MQFKRWKVVGPQTDHLSCENHRKKWTTMPPNEIAYRIEMESVLQYYLHTLTAQQILINASHMHNLMHVIAGRSVSTKLRSFVGNEITFIEFSCNGLRYFTRTATNLTGPFTSYGARLRNQTLCVHRIESKKLISEPQIDFSVPISWQMPLPVAEKESCRRNPGHTKRHCYTFLRCP